jgi:hypothetical protein
MWKVEGAVSRPKRSNDGVCAAVSGLSPRAPICRSAKFGGTGASRHAPSDAAGFLRRRKDSDAGAWAARHSSPPPWRAPPHNRNSSIAATYDLAKVSAATPARTWGPACMTSPRSVRQQPALLRRQISARAPRLCPKAAAGCSARPGCRLPENGTRNDVISAILLTNGFCST